MTTEELDAKAGEWVKASGLEMTVTQRHQLLSLMGAVFNGAIAAERERCAKDAEDSIVGDAPKDSYGAGYDDACRELAKRLRKLEQS